MASVHQSLFTRRENGPLILFRILFGLLMIAESIGAIALGWVHETFVDVRHTFTFFGFEWTDFMLGHTMTVYYVIMGVLGFGIMLGYRYIQSMVLFSMMWALSYFMQKSHYNNHYYLVILVSFCMIFMPAHRYASLDVKWNRVTRLLTCPNWCILYFKIQFAIVYLYAALAKLYPDWLQAKPLSIWLGSKTNFPIIGGLLAQDWFPFVIAYGGLFFDAMIIPFLLIKKTRLAAVLISLVFHIFNSAVFQVGIFPYFALGVAIFFFEPDQIRKLFLKRKPHKSQEVSSSSHVQWIKVVFIIYFIIQVLLPLRHHFIPGNVLWDDAGHRLSWRMMLRSKSGYCNFRIAENGIIRKKISPNAFLSRHQISDAATRPDMLYRSITYLKEHLAEKDIAADAIYCDCLLSVNGRPYTTFVDPEFNMLDVKWNYFGQQEWIADEPDLGFQ